MSEANDEIDRAFSFGVDSGSNDTMYCCVCGRIIPEGDICYNCDAGLPDIIDD
jgi:hypothetical protein